MGILGESYSEAEKAEGNAGVIIPPSKNGLHVRITEKRWRVPPLPRIGDNGRQYALPIR
jgi:hypothetical protein